MSRLPNEDLFEGRKMSFGEHLEELRVALVRSLLGLAVGVVLGFFVSKQVINIVVAPLEKSLKQYYIDRSVEELVAEYGMDDAGKKDLEDSIAKHGLVYQDFFMDRRDAVALVDGDFVSAVNNEAIADSPADDANSSVAGVPEFDFVRVRLWRDVSYRIQTISTTESFFSWMKVSLISGLTISAPWIFLQLWIFVAEGLYPSERKYVYIYLPFSLLLFAAGACMAYFFVFQPVLDFLLSFNSTMSSEPNLRISEWLSFFLLLPLGFGVGFQLPLVMLFINRIGLVSVEAYLTHWRIAILAIFVAAMFLTPSDPQSMLLLALPLTVLYFLGIALCHFLPQRNSPFGEGFDPAT